MYKTSLRYVRKVHPVTRHVEAGDPLELVANSALGNTDWMLECVVHEFAGLGYDADELTNLFRSPAYPVLNQLLDHFGPGEIRRRIDSVLTRSGVFRTREVIADDPDQDDDCEPELIQLSVLRRD